MPSQFFSLRTRGRLRSALEPHGEVERDDAFHTNLDNDWQYRFAVLRCG